MCGVTFLVTLVRVVYLITYLCNPEFICLNWLFFLYQVVVQQCVTTSVWALFSCVSVILLHLGI